MGEVTIKVEEIKDVEHFVIKNVEKKNKCLMIVNAFKDDVKGRSVPGLKKDADDLKETLEHFDYEVDVKEDVKGAKIFTEINMFLKMGDWVGCDSVAFALFTHENEDGELVGSDGNAVDPEFIIKLFSMKKEFGGIPKLFFINVGRGFLGPKDKGVPTAGATQRVQEANLIVFYSAFCDLSLVHAEHGSVWMQALNKIMRAYGGKYSLQDIATKLNHIMHENAAKETHESEVRHTLTHDVFLKSDGTYPQYSAA